jgi:hypothetical protein
LRSLDETLLPLPLPAPGARRQLAPEGPTAVVLVESYSGLGIHTFLWIHRLFPNLFQNFVFVSVGLVDSAQFKGVDELGALERKVRADLAEYVRLAERLGMYAESRHALGIDVAQELETLCAALASEMPRPVVFAGRLVFERERLLTRSLHDEAAYAIQRRLMFLGIQTVILPVRVWDAGEVA